MCIYSLNRIFKCVKFVSGTPGLLFFHSFHLFPCRGGMNHYRHRWKVKNVVETTRCVSHWQTSQGVEKGDSCEGWIYLVSTEPQARSSSGGRNLVSTMLREEIHAFQLLVHYWLCTHDLLCATQCTATRTTDVVPPSRRMQFNKEVRR